MSRDVGCWCCEFSPEFISFDVTSSDNLRRNFQQKDAVTNITTAPKNVITSAF